MEARARRAVTRLTSHCGWLTDMAGLRQLTGTRLVIVLLMAQIGAAVAPARCMEVGVNVHMGDYPLGVTQSALHALDVGFRADVPWKDIELTPGKLQYPGPNTPLDHLDALVTDAAQRRQQPLLILAYGNKAYDGGGFITSPQGIAAFAKYAAFTVAHFKGRAADFEIWNEWNHGLGSRPGGAKVAGQARAYVDLLKAAHGSIKAANPQGRVIGGAVAGTDTEWITQFAEAQGLSYLDAISVHPYVHCNARRTPRPPSDLRLQGWITQPATRGHALRAAASQWMFKPDRGTPEEAIAWLDQLKTLLDKYSPSRSIPVYISEMGWPTSTGQCGVPQTVAAAYLQRFMLLATARPWIEGIWWYDLFDDGNDPGSREDRFGLAATDRSPKPAYQALSALSDVLKSPRAATEKTDSSGVLTITGSTVTGKPFTASWLPTDTFDTRQSWSQGSQLVQQGFKAAAPQADSSAVSATPLILFRE
jgi:hypothetical protein